MTRYRSYDFSRDREHWAEGEGVGFAVCGFHPTEPEQIFTEITLGAVAALPDACVHLMLRIDTECPAWAYDSNRIGVIVFPVLAENGEVVPLP